MIEIGPRRTHVREVGDILHPEREDEAVLTEIQQAMGLAMFSAQYQQRPVPASGNLVDWSWFPRYVNIPPHDADGRIYQSWDTGSRIAEFNDYSACTTWLHKRGQFYLLHSFRERLLYPDLRKKIIEMANRFAAHAVLIEEAGSGFQLIPDLRRRLRPIAIKPYGDKVFRFSNVTAWMEAGRVHLPKEAPWLEDFKAEILAFRRGKFDDQVDSVSQFLNWHINRPKTGLSRVYGV